MTTNYAVCDRLLDAETNEHCEFDGDVEMDFHLMWRCPWCKALRFGGDAGLAERNWLTPNLNVEGGER